MKIEIDLNDLGFSYDEEGDPAGAATLQDLVVQEVARLLLQGTNLPRLVREKVEERVQQEVDEKVAELVAEAVQKPIQRTNPYGEKRGEPVTLLEMIGESLEAYLNRPARNSRNPYGSDKPGNLAELIGQETERVIGREMAETIKQTKSEVYQTITAKALEVALTAVGKKAL